MKLNTVTFGAKLWIDTSALGDDKVRKMSAKLREQTGFPVGYEFDHRDSRKTLALGAKSDDVELLRRLGRESGLAYQTDRARCDNRKCYPAPEGFITVA